MSRGRPLRFLALVLSAWVAVRVVVLWPETPHPGTRVAAEPPVTSTSGGESFLPQQFDLSAPLKRPAGVRAPVAAATRAPVGPEPVRRTVPVRIAVARGGTPPFKLIAPRAKPDGAGPTDQRPAEPPVAVLAGAAAPAPGGSRLAGGAWLVARPGGGQNLAFGQLGASQAGVRLTYALGRARRVALSGRLSAPLRGRGREGAVGLDWQPTRLPVHLLVEERIPLDGGPARPAAQLIAGVAKPLPLGARLDAYGQAGAVHRRGAFADGAALVTRPVASLGGARVEAGAGAWGAAQRGVARVDIGPTLAVAVPVGRASVRLGVDYRLRVAGQARPGSGPALTLGASF